MESKSSRFTERGLGAGLEKKGVRMGLKEVILVVSIIIALVVAIPIINDNHKMIKEMEEFLDQKNGRNRK